MVKKLAYLAFTFLVGCGSSSSDTTSPSDSIAAAENAKNLANAVKLSVLGKTLYVENKLYSASCNPLDFSFISTQTFTCKTAKANSDFIENWTITSTDKTFDVKGTESKDNATLTIDGNTYYCLNYSGSVFTEDGSQKFFGGHVILSKTLATKPSELKADDSYLIANSFDDVCEALF